MLFEDIAGQDQFKEKWVQIVEEDKLPHAILLSGKEGYGALPLTLAFIQYLNCQNRRGGQACGICPACRKTAGMIHPDVHFVFPITQNKEKKIFLSSDRMDDWRTAVLSNSYITRDEWVLSSQDNKQGLIYKADSDRLLHDLSFKAYESEYKIAVIWAAETMNTEAGNTLLKLLEEPPQKTVFFLLSAHPDKMLPTILSRTQKWNLQRIDDEAISSKLVKDLGISHDEARKLASVSEGDYAEALSRYKESLSGNDFLEIFKAWMRLCWLARSSDPNRQKQAMLDLIRLSEKIADMGRENIKQFIAYCSDMMRQNLLLHYGTRSITTMTPTEQEFSENFSAYISQNNIFSIIEELNLASDHIAANGNEKIVVTDLVIKLIRLIR